EHGDPPGGAVARHEDRSAVLLPALQHLREPLWQRRQPQSLSRAAWPHRLPLGPELPPHPDPRGRLPPVRTPAKDTVTDQIITPADRTDPTPPETGAARTTHRLQLPRDTAPADVLTMVGNVRPDAELREDGGIEIGDDARLLPDTGPRGAGRWTLDTPRERELPAPEGLGDSHGYGRAFPDGIPFGAERRALDLPWSLGRRLYGAVVTDSGSRLEPHPFPVRDLTVVSPHALAPGSLAQLLAPLEPDAELDQVPEGTPRNGYSVTVP